MLLILKLWLKLIYLQRWIAVFFEGCMDPSR